jgi:hypothetical protein
MEPTRMAILLPTDPVPQRWRPRVLDWGGELTPVLGGEVQRLNRIGDRLAVDVVLTATPDAALAQAYIARLRRGRRDGARLAWPQLNLAVGNPGAPTVNGGGQAGSSLAVKGLTPGYRVREGQFFSLVSNGCRYVHMIAAASVVPPSGFATLPIEPMLRVLPSNHDVVELAAPMIEGLVSGLDQGWTVDIAGTVGLSFTITEQR